MHTLFDLTATSPVFADALHLVLLCTLKAALVLAAAGAVAAALYDASASARHWVWSLGLGGVLLVTALTLGGPTWTVPWNGSGVLASEVTVAAEAPPAPAAAMEEAGSSALASSAQESHAVSSPATAASTGSLLSWIDAAVLLYGAGVLVVLLYFVVGTLRARRWSRRAEPVTDYALLKQAEAVEDELDLARHVRLLWSDRAAMPVTWGFTRPVLLLPRRAAEWTEERRRVVLLHEMAHIRRWDGLTQTAAQLACALHWFNPFVWWAARQLRIERERACDDVVLRRGAKASSYADHLLKIARSYTASPGHPIGATSMARKSQLEHRLLAILDADTRRQAMGRVRVALSGVLVAALLVPLAALRPAPASPAQPASVTASATPDAPSPSPQASYAPSAPATDDADVIRRSFDVQPGETLVLRSDLGSVEVSTHDANSVDVEVHREAEDEETIERFNVQFEQQNGSVHIRGEKGEDGGWFSGWGGDDLEVRYHVTVPRRFNADLETAGGSIRVADLEGEVIAETAGGSLRLGNISGNVQGETAGGSIRLDSSTGDATLETAGGSIGVGDIDGNVTAETAGGSIELGRVRGTVEAETAGGSIRVEEVGGQINAETAGGSITARITEQPQGDSKLSSAAGSVTVYLAEGVGVNLDAEASFGRINSEFHDQRDDESNELTGPINGGGPELRLRASVGNIHIRQIGSAKSDARPAERPGWRQQIARWPSSAGQAAAATLQTASEQAGQVAWSVVVQPVVQEANELLPQWVRGFVG